MSTVGWIILWVLVVVAVLFVLGKMGLLPAALKGVGDVLEEIDFSDD